MLKPSTGGRNASASRKGRRAAAETARRNASRPKPQEVTLGLDALDLSPDCIKIIGFDGRLRHMNRAGCLALGVEQGSAGGREWAKLLPEQIHKEAYVALCQARTGKDVRFPGLSDGGPAGLRYWDNMLTPLRGASGAVEQILCVSRDITRQREMEGQVSALTTEVGKQSRILLDALHDIQGTNGPMNGAGIDRALENLGDPITRLKTAIADAEALIGRATETEGGNAPATGQADPPSAEPMARPDLTSKELECLLWVVLGKTAWETASIIGRSPRTVEFHLANAVKKLGAANKTQAAMLALRSGLI